VELAQNFAADFVLLAHLDFVGLRRNFDQRHNAR
jgi:hypothetical protein